MKRIFTFLFISFCSVSLLFSQVKLTKVNHGFLSGQSHDCREVSYQTPGNAGENLYWDFSGLGFADDAVSVSSLEENAGESNIKVVRNDGCTFFFNITEKGNEYTGYQAGDVTFRLSQPIVKTTYPQAYNTYFEGKYSGTLTVANSSYTTNFEGQYSTHADATGTIVLPGNITVPALRVKTTEGNGTSYEQVKYLWYTQNDRFPIFVTMENYAIDKAGLKTLTSGKSFLNTRVKSPNVATGLESLTAGTAVCKVSPNPFKDEIQLTFSLSEKTKVNVALYNANGAKLTDLISDKEQSGNSALTQNIAKFTQTPGVYLLKIQLGNKTFTEKIVKAY
ncbi:MAG: T9SS type A sorting domain-containing protein [Dysgonamonadaceae bacterium]|jgi:hypothetical protein|nr:T9SS type A sorting domain-containing protein [Dysgonamonadaceae bacterium]